MKYKEDRPIEFVLLFVFLLFIGAVDFIITAVSGEPITPVETSDGTEEVKTTECTDCIKGYHEECEETKIVSQYQKLIHSQIDEECRAELDDACFDSCHADNKPCSDDCNEKYDDYSFDYSNCRDGCRDLRTQCYLECENSLNSDVKLFLRGCIIYAHLETITEEECVKTILVKD